MLKDLVSLWRDQQGITTAEVVLYTLLFAGVAGLVGYGFAGMNRGKTADIVGAAKSMKAMSGAVTDTSTYSYTVTTDTKTGIPTGATGN